MRLVILVLIVASVLSLVGCKTTQRITTAEVDNYYCDEDPVNLRLLSRSGTCEEALAYMKSIMEIGSFEISSEGLVKVNYKLKGIKSELLNITRNNRFFHLSPECFVGLSYDALLEVPEVDSQQLEKIFAKYSLVRLELSYEEQAVMNFEIAYGNTITTAGWAMKLEEEALSKDTITNYFLMDQSRSVSIEYTKALLGPSRKTISTRNNTLLISTSITGDNNSSNLRCLSRCYFNPEHFVGLKINEFLGVFAIDSLGEGDIAIISKIIVKIKGHSQLIMGVTEGAIVSFKYN